MAGKNHENIDGYFKYVRGRASNLRRLLTDHGRDFIVERHIVLAVMMDGLAARWAHVTRKSLAAGARMCEFLLSYASPNFARCSGPDLLRRARRDGYAALIAPIESALTFHPLKGVVRDWHEDPLVADLLRSTQIVAAAGTIEWKKAGGLPIWLSQSRFGEMLYYNFRNAFVHSLGPNMDLVPVDGDPEFNDEPNYENVTHLVDITDDKVEPFSHERPDPEDAVDPEGRYTWYTRKTPRVQFLFLLDVLDTVIAGFERECRERGLDPVPAEWH